MAQPPAKRMKLAVPAGAAAAGGTASPRSRRLRHTLLVVLFMVRVSVRNTVPASVSQIGGMVQRYVDQAFHKFHEMISSKLDNLQVQIVVLSCEVSLLFSKLDNFQGQVERKLETFPGQVEGLRQEVRQLAHLCSNRHADRCTGVQTNQEHVGASGSKTNIRLRFLNGLKPPIYTDKYITAENNAGIKVAIFEGNQIITSGPLSKAKVEILVLRGDFSNNYQDNWTKEEFDKHIVQGRDGQGLVLGTAWLTNGVVEYSQIRFKEGSCRTPSRKFIMAARVCKSEMTTVRVQEAIMKPVEVKDRRNEANEKRQQPRLDDDVYRLEEIAKDGVYHRRLQNANIYKVEHFLKALNEDSDKLRGILKMERQRNSWSKLIEHAKRSVLGDRQELKRYQSEDGNVVLFFNCVHELVGAAFPCDYVAFEGFDTVQKALVNKWKGHAYNKLEDIPPDYVMKGNIPEPIVPGTGASGNLPLEDNNPVTEPIFPAPNYAPMITGHDLNTLDYQGQITLLHGQQQTSTGSDWQQNLQGPMDFPDLSDQVDIFLTDFESHDVPQPHQMVPAATPAWTTTAPAQPSVADQEQGPSCPAFPGSGR